MYHDDAVSGRVVEEKFHRVRGELFPFGGESVMIKTSDPAAKQDLPEDKEDVQNVRHNREQD